MVEGNKKIKIAFYSAGFSGFLFFSFVLSIRGAHSLAMLCTLLTAFFALFSWTDLYKNTESKVLAVFLVVLAVFWSHSFDGWLTWWTEGDFFVKYALGAFCAITIANITISPRVLGGSLALGCISAGVLAIYQFPIFGRSEGFTNAIRFGDIAIYMGVACWILAAACGSRIERMVLVMGGAMGVLASLLSLSRGGWILLACLPLLAMYFVPQHYRARWFAALCMAIVLLAAAGSQVPALQKRLTEASQEVSGYFSDPDKYVSTSVGARVEQWRLSWVLGASKPLTGWGERGYAVGKEKLIAEGMFHPYLREIHHSHNDFLEMWAKRGVLGVSMLLAIYWVPLWIFYPTRRRISSIAENERSLFVALSLVGVMLPVSYFMFGWTDVFFNLSIGHNFLIFTLIFVLAAVNWVRRHHSAVVLGDIHATT